MTVGVFSPVEGTLHPLSAVNDPTFAKEIVGPGVAIYPSSLEPQIVRSPVEGTITQLMHHSVVVVTRTGVLVLVHLGINTISLEGEGFVQMRNQGDNVRAGDPLLQWTPQTAVDAGLDPMVPVIILDSKELGVTSVAEYDSLVSFDDLILEVDLHPIED